MNHAQERHAKAMANKIITHVDRMRGKMAGIVGFDLAGVPVETVEKLFNELAADWKNIESVVRDMLPALAEQ